MSGIGKRSFQKDQEEDLTKLNELHFKQAHNYSAIQLQILNKLKTIKALSSSSFTKSYTISEPEMELEPEIQQESVPDPLAFKPEDVPAVSKKPVRILTCPICNYKQQGNQYNLSCHIKSRHPEVTKTLICLDCPLTFEKQMELNHHLVTDHPDDYKAHGCRVLHTKHKCPHCNKGFNSTATLANHIIVHSDKKPYECEKCNSKFKRASGLREHKIISCQKILAAIAIRHVKCPQCDKAFITKLQLDGHLQRMHGIQPNKPPPTKSPPAKPALLSCLFCDYKTKYTRHLTVHNRRHTGEKPVRCQECGARILSSSALERHYRVFCPANKNSSVSLKKGANSLPLCCQKTPGKCPKPTYTGSGPFCCTGCGKTFNKLPSMHLHLRLYCPAQKQHDFEAVTQGQVLPPLRQALCCQKTPGKCPKPSYTGYGPFSCTGCGIKIAEIRSILRHLKVSCPATKQHAQNAQHSAKI